MSWMPLDDLASIEIMQNRLLPTDVPPGITGFVDFHSGCYDICRIAEIRQPHVFNMKTVECFIQGSVEFVSLVSISRHGKQPTPSTDSSVSHDGVGDIGQYPPDVTHTSTEPLCSPGT